MPLNVLALSAKSYIVMDMDTNRVIMGSNYNSPMLIASTSKIMTCIIALEKGKLDKKVEVTKDVLKITGSSIYLDIKEKIKLRDLLYGMMLRSGNDASVMIALEISGSMDSFSKLMNEYASKIGMKNSVFYNSHGLEEPSGLGNMSTSYDMALLMSYAMKNKEFRKIVSTRVYKSKSDIKSYEWYNKNKLLKYDYITGGKTGYTTKSRRTLVSSANINNMNIVVVTLNDPNDWIDHKNIYDNIKNNYQKVRVLDKNDFHLTDDSLFLEDIYYIKKNIDVIVHDNDLNNIKIKYYLNEERKNKKVGYVKVFINNKEVSKTSIYKRKR